MGVNAVTMAHPGESLSRSGELSKERLERLFDDHHQRLYRLARRLCLNPEDSRDMVQETCLRAARRLGSVPAAAGHEEAWLVRVLINISKDVDRRRRVRERAAPLTAPAATRTPSPERYIGSPTCSGSPR
jgi:RNA polymerase sigma-70 factor (ECF subfamily)